MEILNVTNLLDKLIPTNIFFKDNLIFIKQNDNYENVGLYKYNLKTKQIEKYKFKKIPEIITYISSNNIIYYGYMTTYDNNFALNIQKIDCNNWIEEDILTIKTGSVNNKGEGFFSSLNDCRIFGLNERYAILAIPHNELIYGRPFFEKIMLIDSVEKTSLLIPDKVGESDSLLRLYDAWIVKNGEFIVFKTGGNTDKKRIWHEQLPENSHNEYIDDIETIISIKIEDFIANIKKWD